MSILIAQNERELARKKERFGGGFGLIGTPDQVVDGLQRYVQAGSQYITFNMPDANEVEPILLFGETVIPHVARM
jgi:alkanesulfonate monooxygenase SsuD/methylene tetrahydromethanopterin reductase-like flavin-dependent oxidoreductase (luciferase family)